MGRQAWGGKDTHGGVWKVHTESWMRPACEQYSKAIVEMDFAILDETNCQRWTMKDWLDNLWNGKSVVVRDRAKQLLE